MKKTILLVGVLLLGIFLSEKLLANYSDNTDKCHGKTDRVNYIFLPCLSLLNNDVTFHVTSNGNDLEGAWVTVGPVALPTNASGIAIFSLEDGDYSYTVTKEGFADAEGSFTVAGSPLLIEVEMEVCWNITIHVISGGVGLTGCTITIGDLVFNNDTTSTVCLPEGVYPLTVTKEGYYPYNGSITVNGSPQTKNIILIPMSYPVTFFVNCCGEPLEGIMLTIGTVTVITGADGLAVFNLTEGDYTVEINDYIFTFSVPETTYIDADICSEVTFQVGDEQGNPLENVLIDVDGSYLITDFNGEAYTCLQVGNYTYVASKPGFVTQIGTFEMDTIPQTVEIVMPAETWGLTFQISGLECENEFEGLIVIINGDTLLPGETINLANGIYNYYVVLIGCGFQHDGMVTINNTPITVYVILPGLPQVTFHVTDQWLADFEGAAVNVEDDILYTDYLGEVSFCVTGGYHDYWVANPGYDTIPNYFVFPCQDTTIEVMLMTGSIRKEKMTQLDIYPNPSTGKFYLETTKPGNDPIELQVMDLTGRIVNERQPAISEKFEIDLSGQPKGMYFIRAKAGEMVVNRKVIIK